MNLDLTVVRSLITVVLFVLFVGVVVWAYGKGRKRDFDEAARLALDDDPAPSSRRLKEDHT